MAYFKRITSQTKDPGTFNFLALYCLVTCKLIGQFMVEFCGINLCVIISLCTVLSSNM